ncbi:C4-dicarboxylate transporter DcuC [Shimwellia blattae]|uniref:Anaerobic C4-dicarboxylate transporter DcuC n=1 Tax=Shimwellia blattae (strain ATCC 29907 / DSM 4481 / JCM 1650 / NBRC 105725 / CDC 9005-74) TaxID=630626 RepID=I2B4S8_SHIBC|nr:C4-dicarboxylate transporter DcuC [Shimwellia blattae]AFJ45532.1 anaerobic C4-dicarboxylate transporter DcuC [Shimwellia blattae DSM 4481 = NBRC 105725]GAB81527.1 putative C4-dicarboxylate transporter DcuD [Shimwellia blattae DSM 4481 = NBRC 105725]VDY63016.1 Putative cryptic C4-dicarboxylate transporter DcuD [Shimwellia blattae]VEC20131.1 Putative cryptic C4-dicarboxylate transporter DcuD [Shimwellia blattae]
MPLIIALIAILFAGRLILKRYHPQSVLLLTGIALLLIAQFTQGVSLSSLVHKTTGLGMLDAFEYIRDTLSSRTGGLGLQIMLIGGFATYMSVTGASQVLVRIASRPLQRLNSPYLLLALALVLGQFLSLFISSATGLGLLLMATLYPLLIRLGCSRAAVAAVIASTCAVEFGPGSGNSVLAAKTAGIEIVDYFVNDQLPVVVPVILFVALVHALTQRFFDKRAQPEAASGDPLSESRDSGAPQAPLLYLLLPMLPLAIMLLCSKLVFSSLRITLDTAVLLSLAIALICEYIRWRNARDVMAGLQKVFDTMGGVFASVITLIVAGEVFSAGLKAVGAVDSLLSLSGDAGLSAASIILLMTLITFVISALMGSGNAAFFSFAPMIPQISEHIGSNVAVMMLPVQISAGIGRTLSPIAGVIIAIAGIAGVSPVEIVKRTALPMLSGWLLMIVITFLRSGHLMAIVPWLAGLVVVTVAGVMLARNRRKVPEHA